MITKPIWLLILAAWSLKSAECSPFDETITHLNKYRAQFQAPPLMYSDQLSQVAQDWADYLAKSNQFKHSTTNRYGENIAMLSASSQSEFNRIGADAFAKNAIDLFNVEEEKLYDWNRPGYSDKTGHFTQNVWIATKMIGIGVAYNPDTRRVLVVNNFDPPGNVGGPDNFRRNVLPRKDPISNASPPPPPPFPKVTSKPPPPQVKSKPPPPPPPFPKVTSKPPPPQVKSKPPPPPPPPPFPKVTSKPPPPPKKPPTNNRRPPPSPPRKNRPIKVFIRKAMPRI
jgi:hypothetical protein